VTLLALMSSVPHAPESLIKWFYAFLVPLAVFLSGFVWKDTSTYADRVVIRQLIRRWFLPYLFLTLVSWILGLLLGNISWWRSAIGLLYGVDGFGHWMEGNSALWFFPFLISVHFIAHWLWKYHWLWIVGLSFLGLIWLRFSPFPMPWGLDVALVAMPFFALGAKLRHLNLWKEPRRWSPWISFAFLIVFTLGALKGWIPLADWNAGRLRPEWVVMSLSIMGLAAWLPMARLMDLSWIGRHSLWIYGLHIPLYHVFSWVVSLLLGRSLHSPDFLYLMIFYPLGASLLVMRARIWLMSRNQFST